MSLSAAYQPAPFHTELGPSFFDAVEPAHFPMLRLRYRNQRWARRVGLDALGEEEWLNHFGRFAPLPGNLAQPLALRYHGHQFGAYNPHLGDGRGFLYAQMRDDKGRLLDLGTKGSGLTPWSRHGDGRLTLNGGLREVLATEMLEALGVETSKSFSLIETGEDLTRSDEPSPTRSSVLVRLSHSHIRIGTFQRFAHLDDVDSIRALLAYCIKYYLPEAEADTEQRRAVNFLASVARRVGRMGAQWMAAGFVHGVVNSDNVNITGESFDYGPWRFLPTYDPTFTAAYFDQGQRYAFARQPGALWWNLARLAETLQPLAPQEELAKALDAFETALEQEFAASIVRRLALRTRGAEADSKLANALMDFLLRTQAPFEQVFFDWYGGLASEIRAAASPAAASYRAPDFALLRVHLAEYEPASGIDLDHPYFRGGRPCTMLIDEVETILGAVNTADDWSPFETKLNAIAEMADAYRLENGEMRS